MILFGYLPAYGQVPEKQTAPIKKDIDLTRSQYPFFRYIRNLLSKLGPDRQFERQTVEEAVLGQSALTIIHIHDTSREL